MFLSIKFIAKGLLRSAPSGLLAMTFISLSFSLIVKEKEIAVIASGRRREATSSGPILFQEILHVQGNGAGMETSLPVTDV